MKVIQSLNQNALLVQDDSGNEFITLGKGIGFGVKKGDDVVESKITTIYSIKSTVHEQKILEQLKDIDENALIMAEEVGKMANDTLTDDLNESFVFSLANHLQYSIERNMSQDIPLQPFHHEIKYLYPKEYVLAERSVDYLNDKYQLALHESEKAFFTLHFVNGLKDSANFQETVTLSNILNDIVTIIEKESACMLDKTSVDYSRFIVHLRYFLIRQMQTPTIASEDESNLMELYQSSASLFTKQRDIVQKLTVFLDEQHSMVINHAEAFYLLIHLIRVLDH